MAYRSVLYGVVPIVFLSLVLSTAISEAAVAKEPSYGHATAMSNLGGELDALLSARGSTPVSLAATDLDGDGVPDLIAGYSDSDGGVLAVFRGNIDALFPGLPDARARRTSGTSSIEPFFASGFSVELGSAPDLLAAGDFDGDGNNDLVAARLGEASISFLRGSGAGTLLAARVSRLPGPVSALAAGPLDGPFDRDSVVVGLGDAGGTSPGRMLILHGPDWGRAITAGSHATESIESIDLDHPARSIALAHLDGDPWGDVVVAGGHGLTILRDRGGRDTSRPPRKPETFPTASLVLGIAAGRFGASMRHGDDVAAFFADGTAAKLDGSMLRESLGAAPRLVWLPPAGAERISDLRVRPVAGGDAAVLSLPASRLEILSGAALTSGSGDAEGSPEVSNVVAMVPMRLNRDAIPDFAILSGTSPRPQWLLSLGGPVWVVDHPGDTPDATPWDGFCEDAGGWCTLRAAITESQLQGPDTIEFDLGPGVPSISFAGGLGVPPQTVIDGNTGGARRVQVTGSAFDGLYLNGQDVIRSLVVNRSRNDGIYTWYSESHVEDCYIGTDAAGGATVSPNARNGVLVECPGGICVVWPFGNVIGGAAPEQRNVISNNAGSGVRVDWDAGWVQIRGNYIGTDATGTVAVPNRGNGVISTGDASGPGIYGNVISGNTGGGVSGNAYTGLSQNLIGTDATGSTALPNAYGAGGTLLATGNLISGNTGIGVILQGDSFYDGYLRGNKIGTNLSGNAPIPNGGDGVVAGGKSIGGNSGLTPGGCTGDCNVIAWNDGAGIRVNWSLAKVAIRGNSIFANDGLGIDLGTLGVTTNDPSDGDAGPNELQNFPTLVSATHSAGTTVVKGTLSSTPNTEFAIDVYDGSGFDPSGYGEGGVWIGSASLTTDGAGLGTFTVTSPILPSHLTATATAIVSGITSEFSGGAFDPGEASAQGTMTAVRGGGTTIDLAFTPACAATDHAAFLGVAGPGTIGGGLGWSDAYCGLGTSGTAGFDPGDPAAGSFFYFVVVGQAGTVEGSYGRGSSGERPEAVGIGACDEGQIVILAACP